MASNPLDDSSTQEEVVGLTLQEIESCRAKIRLADPYPCTRAVEGGKNRNVIMLGRSGAGKSTIITLLQDIAAASGHVGLFAGTEATKFSKFSIHPKASDTTQTTPYTINIVDTPGVDEVRRPGENSRSDQSILTCVETCLSNELDQIHCIILCISFSGKIQPADKDAFRIYLEMFKSKDLRIAICLTHCETLKPEEEEAIFVDLTYDPYFKELIEQNDIPIFYCGVVSQMLIKSAATEQRLMIFFKDVHRRREKLLKFIFGCEGAARLEHVPFMVRRRENVMRIQSYIRGFVARVEFLKRREEEERRRVEEYKREEAVKRRRVEKIEEERVKSLAFKRQQEETERMSKIEYESTTSEETNNTTRESLKGGFQSTMPGTVSAPAKNTPTPWYYCGCFFGSDAP